MTEQDDDIKGHEWMITHEDHSPPDRFYRFIECKNCNAAQKIEYPSGDVVAHEGALWYCTGTPDEDPGQSHLNL